MRGPKTGTRDNKTARPVVPCGECGQDLELPLHRNICPLCGANAGEAALLAEAEWQAKNMEIPGYGSFWLSGAFIILFLATFSFIQDGMSWPVLIPAFLGAACLCLWLYARVRLPVAKLRSRCLERLREEALPPSPPAMSEAGRQARRRMHVRISADGGFWTPACEEALQAYTRAMMESQLDAEQIRDQLEADGIDPGSVSLGDLDA